MSLNSTTWLAALCIFSSLASASPTPIAKQSKYLEYRPYNPLAKRAGNIGSYGPNDLPTCDADPSYASGTSQFTDGQGTLQASGCDNHKGGDQHCWTDTFVVYWTFEYEDWTPSGQVIDCEHSSTCSEQNLSLNKTCTEVKITAEDNVKATLEAKLPEWFEGWVPSFNFVSTDTVNNLESEKICQTTSSTGSCSWNDQACHGIWTAQQNRRVWGYQRRTCTSARSGTNTPGTTRRADGLYTVGIQDFNILIPDSSIIGCAAQCGVSTYPDPVPTEPGTSVAISG